MNDGSAQPPEGAVRPRPPAPPAPALPAWTATLPADQLPFLLCRRHGLPWRCERSFKVEAGAGVLNHRYVLGIPRERIAPRTWIALLHDLELPQRHPELIETLTARLDRASTVYLGFEQGLNGANLRLYFEDWEAVVERLRRTPAEEIRRWESSGPPLWPMGVGYKWPVGAEAGRRLSLTRYEVRPLLEGEAILTRVRALLQTPTLPETPLVWATLALLQRILASDPAVAPVFLEVDEPGTPRRSFDLCVHRYQLRLRELAGSLQPLLACLLGPGAAAEHLLAGCPAEAWITHVSAGQSRHGLPYACVYHEPLDGP